MLADFWFLSFSYGQSLSPNAATSWMVGHVNPLLCAGACVDGHKMCRQNERPRTSPKNSRQFFAAPKSYGFVYVPPSAANRFVSDAFMWYSMLVSPRRINLLCQIVNEPNAIVTAAGRKKQFIKMRFFFY